MQSIEFVPSPDDPSPKIAELVDATLRLSLTTPEYDIASPETEPLTLHSYDGAVILQKLLPDLSPDTLWALRDAIVEQDAPEAQLLPVEPTSLFGGWLKKARALWAPQSPEPTQTPAQPKDVIEIVEPIIGRTKQLHIKSLPRQHAIVVRRSSFEGSARINGELFEFNPTNAVLEVGKVVYNPNPTEHSEYFAQKSRRHYTLVSGTGDIYRGKQYGGAFTDRKIETETERKKAFQKMTSILEEIHTTPELRRW
ncbi:MAG: hypothetical protein ACREGE_00725 [Candidatus Microsaccharimonas sp.]